MRWLHFSALYHIGIDPFTHEGIAETVSIRQKTWDSGVYSTEASRALKKKNPAKPKGRVTEILKHKPYQATRPGQAAKSSVAPGARRVTTSCEPTAVYAESDCDMDLELPSELPQFSSPPVVECEQFSVAWAEDVVMEEGSDAQSAADEPLPDSSGGAGVRASIHNPANPVSPRTSRSRSQAPRPRPSAHPAPPSDLVLYLMEENRELKSLLNDMRAQLAALTALLTDKAQAQPSSVPPPAAALAQPTGFTATGSARMETNEPGAHLDPAPAPTAHVPSAAAAPSSGASRPSYASAAACNLDADASAERVNAAAAALCELTHRKPKHAPAEKLTLVYVGGIQRKAISKVKKNLKDLGFDIWSVSIANVSFLGSSTCEFLIAPHYLQRFKHAIANCEAAGLRLLDNFEACRAADPNATSACQEKLKGNLLERVWSIIERPGAHTSVKAFFKRYLESNHLPPLRPVEDTSDSMAMNEDEISLSEAEALETASGAPISLSMEIPSVSVPTQAAHSEPMNQRSNVAPASPPPMDDMDLGLEELFQESSPAPEPQNSVLASNTQC